MRSLLSPKLMVSSVLDITPQLLDRYGIRGLILDADNTLVPRKQYVLEAAIIDWIGVLQLSGRKLCILSNSRHVRRIAAMMEPFGIPTFSLARKPMRPGFRRAMKAIGTTVEETAMIGDQLLTDIVGGNRVGILTIMVAPLSGNDFVLYRFMRPLERRLLQRYQPLSEAVEQAAGEEDD
ncbi:MAG: YqeG family HAD IIIA-type phosphatase [Armatimonadetes bacterium]|nr:YqeG family HAD IIIA-type phosphatase [Armatimonadota bacterium]